MSTTIPDYPYPVPVALVTLCHRGRPAWAVVKDNKVVTTGTGNGTSSEEDQALAGFEVILTHPELKGQPVDLYTNNRRLREALAETRAIAPNVEPIPHVSLHDPRMEMATVAAKDAAIAAGPVALHAATDGAREKSASVGGYGWITEEGQHGYGAVKATSPVEAEIEAIAHLLDAISDDRPIVIHVDSKDAIKLCKKALSGEDTEPVKDDSRQTKKRRTNAVYNAIAHVRKHKGRDVTIEHVKGHSGHALNGAADRLAVLARRATRMGLPTDVVEDVVARIVSETRDALK